ncbi:uncharacterized protein LOC115222491 [Octopus sinensis]|uniref:Uncharacterized protein LOC115222491 n=1 Tax=Octopus sinensis TaxID=2607531 RepID=A0A6P7TC16_9MOLL|nr:uncharacterized protein LOC115222491 [Octopus sinensis]
MDVVALAKTRIHGKGNFAEKSAGYHLFWSGRDEIVFDPTSSMVTSLYSKVGTELLTNPRDIVRKWKEHFDVLLNRPTEVDLFVLDNIPERPTKHHLVEVLNLAEIGVAIRKLNNGKAPGMDGLGAEIYNYGGKHLCTMSTDVIQRVWYSEVVPRDWCYTILEVLYKSKGGKDFCNNCCGWQNPL